MRRALLKVMVPLVAATVGLPVSFYILRTMVPVYHLLNQRKELSARGLFAELPGHRRGMIMIVLRSGLDNGTILARGVSFGTSYRLKPRPPRRPRKTWAERFGPDDVSVGGTVWAR